MNPRHEIGLWSKEAFIKIVLLFTAFLVALAAPSLIRAESLSAVQQKALQREAIPSYPNSRFTSADNGEAVTVLWFRSSDPPGKIMPWYRQELSNWSEIESNGITVLYKGAPGLESKQFSGKPYIFTRRTTENEPVVSEITIRLPKN